MAHQRPPFPSHPPPPLPEWYLRRSSRTRPSSTSSGSSSDAEQRIRVVREKSISFDPKIPATNGTLASLPVAPTPLPDGTNVPPLAVYHVCRVCLRPRSARYHREHPIPLNAVPPPPGICRRCRVTPVEDPPKVIEGVIIEESNDVKFGIRCLVPDADYIKADQMATKKVQAAEKSHTHHEHSPSREPKDVIYRHVRVVRRAANPSDEFRSKEGVNSSRRASAYNSSTHASRVFSNASTVTAAEAESREHIISNHKTHDEKSESSMSKCDSRTAYASVSMTVVSDEHIASSPRSTSSPSRETIQEIARQEIKRYHQEYLSALKSGPGDEQIRDIARDEIARYRRAERMINSHDNAFAHGRLVPNQRQITARSEEVTTNKPWVTDVSATSPSSRRYPASTLRTVNETSQWSVLDSISRSDCQFRDFRAKEPERQRSRDPLPQKTRAKYYDVSAQTLDETESRPSELRRGRGAVAPNSAAGFRDAHKTHDHTLDTTRNSTNTVTKSLPRDAKQDFSSSSKVAGRRCSDTTRTTPMRLGPEYKSTTAESRYRRHKDNQSDDCGTSHTTGYDSWIEDQEVTFTRQRDSLRMKSSQPAQSWVDTQKPLSGTQAGRHASSDGVNSSRIYRESEQTNFDLQDEHTTAFLERRDSVILPDSQTERLKMADQQELGTTKTSFKDRDGAYIYVERQREIADKIPGLHRSRRPEVRHLVESETYLRRSRSPNNHAGTSAERFSSKSSNAGSSRVRFSDRVAYSSPRPNCGGSVQRSQTTAIRAQDWMDTDHLSPRTSIRSRRNAREAATGYRSEWANDRTQAWESDRVLTDKIPEKGLRAPWSPTIPDKRPSRDREGATKTDRETMGVADHRGPYHDPEDSLSNDVVVHDGNLKGSARNQKQARSSRDRDSTPPGTRKAAVTTHRAIGEVPDHRSPYHDPDDSLSDDVVVEDGSMKGDARWEGSARREPRW